MSHTSTCLLTGSLEWHEYHGMPPRRGSFGIDRSASSICNDTSTIHETAKRPDWRKDREKDLIMANYKYSGTLGEDPFS